jgi:excisionase family DNA binding protein
MATTKRDLNDTEVQGQTLTDARHDIVSIDEVARRLDIPKTTLYGWRYKGTGPRGYRVGKHLRYRWSEVLAWLDQLQ